MLLLIRWIFLNNILTEDARCDRTMRKAVVDEIFVLTAKFTSKDTAKYEQLSCVVKVLALVVESIVNAYVVVIVWLKHSFLFSKRVKS